MPYYILLSAVVVLLDQGSKYLAVQYLTDAPPVPLLPVLDLALAYNTGAAFSFLDNAGGWQNYLFIGIAVTVCIWIVWYLSRLKPGQWLLALALSLLLGGAIGNLIDRLTIGKVVDFIHVFYENHHFPIFNLADSAITLAAILLIVDALVYRRHHS